MKHYVQSVLLCRDNMTLQEARKWIKDHNYKDIGVDTTDRFYRFRQHIVLPHMKYKTIELGKTGQIIMAYENK